MKKHTHFYLLLTVLALGITALPWVTQASPGDTIPVQGADWVFDTNTSLSSELSPLLENIYHPCVVRAADGIICVDLVELPPILQSLVNQIPATYFPVRASDSISWFEIAPVPSILQALLGQIPNSYFPVRASDSVFATNLQYPRLLLNDSIPPQIYNVSVSQISGLVEWETDEYATSEVWHGSEPDNYTHVVNDTLLVKEHLLLLTETNAMQHILIRSTDQSGNVGEYYVPGFSISGHVSDENGLPIRDVVVSVSPTQAALTDDNGNYVLAGVLAGAHVITASHSGYDFTPTAITITLSGNVIGINFVGNEKPTEQFVYLPIILK